MSKGKMSRHERAIRSELEKAQDSLSEADERVRYAKEESNQILENIGVLQRLLKVAEEISEKVEAPDRSERQAGPQGISPNSGIQGHPGPQGIAP